MAVAIGIILLKLVIVLAAAKLAGELAERIRQPAVLGELLAGVLLGPSLFGLFDLHDTLGQAEDHLLVFLASLGAILLLLEVGIETKLKDMMSVGKSAGIVALIGLVGSFAFGFGASYALGLMGIWGSSMLFHVFVGATFTATSVGITARVLSDMGRLSSAEARTILGAAVLDDVGGLLILAIITAIAAGALAPGALALKALLAIAFLVVSLAIGIPLAPRILDIVSKARVRGVLVVVAFSIALLMAWGAEALGLASIIGAFAAGLILAQTRQQPALHEKIRSMSDLLVPVFFVYVGLQVDLRGAGQHAIPILVAATVLTVTGILGKLISGLGVLERSTSKLAVGVGMIPRGEVGLIFALAGTTAIVNGEPLIAGWEYTALLIGIALTTFVTPIWLKHILSRQLPAGPDTSGIVVEADAHGQPHFRKRTEAPAHGPGWDGKE